jgi:hypothetical protein
MSFIGWKSKPFVTNYTNKSTNYTKQNSTGRLDEAAGVVKAGWARTLLPHR